MTDLSPMIHAALPWLSFRSRILIDTLLLTGGSLGPAPWLTAQLGLPYHFPLAALLKRDGLPPFPRLRGWITVLHWVWKWEREGVSLSRSALRAGREPAVRYRLVKRITGASWTSVRAAGVHAVLGMFLAECN